MMEKLWNKSFLQKHDGLVYSLHINWNMMVNNHTKQESFIYFLRTDINSKRTQAIIFKTSIYTHLRNCNGRGSNHRITSLTPILNWCIIVILFYYLIISTSPFRDRITLQMIWQIRGWFSSCQPQLMRTNPEPWRGRRQREGDRALKKL